MCNIVRDRRELNEVSEFYENLKLDQNEHKKCWKDEETQVLIDKVVEEFGELVVELSKFNYSEALKESADLTNASKMLTLRLHEIMQKERHDSIKH